MLRHLWSPQCAMRERDLLRAWWLGGRNPTCSRPYNSLCMRWSSRAFSATSSMLRASEILMSGYVEVFPAFQSSETKRGIVEFGLMSRTFYHSRKTTNFSFPSVISESWTFVLRDRERGCGDCSFFLPKHSGFWFLRVLGSANWREVLGQVQLQTNLHLISIRTHRWYCYPS